MLKDENIGTRCSTIFSFNSYQMNANNYKRCMCTLTRRKYIVIQSTHPHTHIDPEHLFPLKKKKEKKIYQKHSCTYITTYYINDLLSKWVMIIWSRDK